MLLKRFASYSKTVKSACTYVRMYAHTYVCSYYVLMHIHVYTQVRKYAHTYVCSYTLVAFMHSPTHVLYISSYLCTYVCTYVCTVAMVNVALID